MELINIANELHYIIQNANLKYPHLFCGNTDILNKLEHDNSVIDKIKKQIEFIEYLNLNVLSDDEMKIEYFYCYWLYLENFGININVKSVAKITNRTLFSLGLTTHNFEQKKELTLLLLKNFVDWCIEIGHGDKMVLHWDDVLNITWINKLTSYHIKISCIDNNYLIDEFYNIKNNIIYHFDDKINKQYDASDIVRTIVNIKIAQ